MMDERGTTDFQSVVLPVHDGLLVPRAKYLRLQQSNDAPRKFVENTDNHCSARNAIRQIDGEVGSNQPRRVCVGGSDRTESERPGIDAAAAANR